MMMMKMRSLQKLFYVQEILEEIKYLIENLLLLINYYYKNYYFIII